MTCGGPPPLQEVLLPLPRFCPGTLIAAAARHGGQAETNQRFCASGKVVTDVTARCAAFGDLRHAIRAGAMSASDVHAQLGGVVAGVGAGRESEEEVIVFDSTGMALQDVAAAAAALEAAKSTGGAPAWTSPDERSARLREVLPLLPADRCDGFGGPIALAGAMQRDLVEERGGSTASYVQGLALAQLAPGRSPRSSRSSSAGCAAGRRRDPRRRRVRPPVVPHGPRPLGRVRRVGRAPPDPGALLRDRSGRHRPHREERRAPHADDAQEGRARLGDLRRARRRHGRDGARNHLARPRSRERWRWR